MTPRPFIVTPHGVIEMRDWAYHDWGRTHYEYRWTCACGDTSQWLPLRHPQVHLLKEGLALHAVQCHQVLSQAGAPGLPPTTVETSTQPPETSGASAARPGTARLPVYIFRNPVASAMAFDIPYRGEIDIDKFSAGPVPQCQTPPDTEAGSTHVSASRPSGHSQDNNGQKGR